MPYEIIELNDDWRFTEGAPENSEAMDFDDSNWRMVDLPHDWSVEREFSPDAPAYCRGAWLPTGKGVYRKRLQPPDLPPNGRIFASFAGVYRNSEVFFNGHLVGGRPWGYMGFECDLTPFLDADGPNVLAVKVDNSLQPGARWYTGSGVYRGVRLVVRGGIHIPNWGVYVTTSEFSSDAVTMNIQTKLSNEFSKRVECVVSTTIIKPDGEEIDVGEKTHMIGAKLLISLNESIELTNPRRWDVDDPAVHLLRLQVRFEGRVVDVFETTFGVREMKYDARDGFFLNGRNLKIKGVCLHNDGGAIGAACFKRSYERQLKMLKEMGCNAVRTAHHPFDELFLDACDEIGMLVLAEAFDEWREPISVMPYSDGEPQRLNVHYYSDIFDEWAERDLRDMLLRDRNHPSVFMWCVGNEIPQMNKASGRGIAETLREIVHNHDKRPVTCSVVSSSFRDANMAVMDVAGYNYPSSELLDAQRAEFPDRLMICTEHYSAQTRLRRGDYLGKDEKPCLPYRHQGAVEFIMSHQKTLPGVKAWRSVAERPYVMGLFIWTGWDYLGEPTPYDWPAHGSFFGVVDLCGFPKDGYFHYKALWREEPFIHICSHWNWARGTVIEVSVVSNCDSATLYLDEQSLGEREIKDGLATWDVEFKPGELKALASKGGRPRAEHVIQTAEKPKRLRLIPYSNVIESGGADVAYVECEIIDSDDNLVPLACNSVYFRAEGAGRLLALDSGDQLNPESFQNQPRRRAHNGKCLAIFRSGRNPGQLRVTAQADGLESACAVIDVKSRRIVKNQPTAAGAPAWRAD